MCKSRGAIVSVRPSNGLGQEVHNRKGHGHVSHQVKHAEKQICQQHGQRELVHKVKKSHSNTEPTLLSDDSELVIYGHAIRNLHGKHLQYFAFQTQYFILICFFVICLCCVSLEAIT